MLQARTVGRLSCVHAPTTQGMLSSLIKEQMITFAQGGGEMRQGGKGEGSCGVIELMKNGVLKAQRFVHSRNWGLRHPSVQLAPSLGDMQLDLFFVWRHVEATVSSFDAWIVCVGVNLKLGRIWLTVGDSPGAEHRFNSCLQKSHPNTRVKHLRLIQTHKKRNDQTL